MPTIDLTNLRRIVNDAYWPFLGDRSRYEIFVGGAGSGKSYFVPQKLAIRLMTERNHHIVAFRKVAKTCKVSVFAQMCNTLDVMGVSSLWKRNLSDLTLTFRPNGNMYRCMGMDDPEKIKSITDTRGNNITSAWLEEATEFTPQDVAQINLRMRGKTENYKQMTLTFNPISALHWINERFFTDMADNMRESRNGNTRIFRTTFLDNRFIDAEYKAELLALREQDEQLYRVYALGLWGLLKGLVYDPFPFSDRPAEPDETIYGIDFGYNHPMVLVRLDIKDQVIYLTEELYQTSMTTSDLVDFMRSINVSPNHPIYADTAEPDRIEEIYRAGFNVYPADKAPGSVNAGISMIKARARQNKIFSNGSNTNLNMELQTYKWREDKDGRFIDDVVKFNDHAMDAMRYAVYTHFKSVFRIS